MYKTFNHEIFQYLIISSYHPVTFPRRYLPNRDPSAISSDFSERTEMAELLRLVIYLSETITEWTFLCPKQTPVSLWSKHRLLLSKYSFNGIDCDVIWLWKKYLIRKGTLTPSKIHMFSVEIIKMTHIFQHGFSGESTSSFRHYFSSHLTHRRYSYAADDRVNWASFGGKFKYYTHLSVYVNK